jgi:hypothetical protein
MVDDLESAVQLTCHRAVRVLQSDCTSEKRKGAEWLLTVGVRYLQTVGVKPDALMFDMYRKVNMDAVEVVLPRRKGYDVI